jgi:hypothetical protein
MTLHEVGHEPRIVNPDPKYQRATLIEPTTLGYLLIAAEVQPRSAPFASNSREKTALLARLEEIAQQIEQQRAVEKVTIFDGIVFAPPNAAARERAGAMGVPRYDVVVLIETQSPSTAREVRGTSACAALLDLLEREARRISVVAARNIKRIDDVDKTRDGVFLFNFFVSDDQRKVVDLWEHLAGWFVTEAGLDNSTLLVPLEGERSDYVAINSARWDGSLLQLFRRQMTKKSFKTYVLANLDENQVGTLPMLYRLANRAPRGATRWVPAVVAGLLAASAVALGVGIGRRLWSQNRRRVEMQRRTMWRPIAWRPIAWRPVAWQRTTWRPAAKRAGARRPSARR